jgi:2,6-dihydroxypyridine 3-monooxygenase
MTGARAAVIGGSLGGLTVANLLRDAGWDVTVYERSPGPLHGSGAGIVVHEATVRYLVERARSGVEQVSCGSSTIRTFDRSGVVFEEPSPYRFTSWTTLYRALLGALGEHCCRFGHSLTGLSEQGTEVELRFANGESACADLVVCADGISSTARRRLLGVAEPVYSGYVGWRGVVSEADLSATTFEVLADALTYGLADHTHVVAYPIPNVDGGLAPGERLVNYVWYRNVPTGPALDELMTGRDGFPRPIAVQPGQVQDRFVDEMRASAQTLLAEPLAEMVERTPNPFLQAIVDITIDRMAFGRIAIIGDAAFAARPHAAAGTAKAAENAWTLAAALGSPGSNDVTAAITSWEVGQLALGHQLVARARAIGERSQVTSTWTPGDPDLRFGLHGPGR